MSASVSRAQVLAAPLSLQPMTQLSAATAEPSPTVAALVAANTPGATQATQAVPDSKAEATAPQATDKTAAQAFAQAPVASDGVVTKPAPLAVAQTTIPAVAGRPGTVATTVKPVMHTQPPSTAGSIGGAVFALVMVVGLILGLGWLAKRLPGFRGASNSNALRVVSSLSLGARERVVVVAVGETQLLIGVGAAGIRTLHTLEQPLPETAPAATPAFAQLLSQHFGKKA